MSNINALSIIDGVDITAIQSQLKSIRAFQGVVNQTLEKDQDFGVIAGTQKPTLLKAGAEKILMLLGLSSEYEIIQQIEDWSKGIFAYTVKCKLHKGNQLITEGLGSCNSKEDKYRYRWAWENELPASADKSSYVTKQFGSKTKYRIENDEIYSQVNTLLKMAKKRAQIDATLTVAALSNVFTQDMEDLKQFIESEKMETMTVGDAGNLKLHFGKHKGKSITELLKEDPQYLDWLLKNDKTDADIKAAIQMVMTDDLDKLTGGPETSKDSKASNSTTKSSKSSQRPQESMPDDLFDGVDFNYPDTPF